MTINSSIFKAYDIRGLYPNEINKDIAFRIGQAYAQYTGVNAVVLGRDMRTSSPELFDALTEGLIDAGADIIDVGLVATPEFYFAVANGDYDGGIMVTASHNPGKYNGFKLVRNGAVPIGAGSGMEEIQDLVLKGEKVSRSRGTIVKIDVLGDYLDKVFSLIDVSKINPRLRVVLDTGNGMAGVVELDLWKRLPCRVAAQHLEPDGNFPNHEANPLKEENVRDLAERIGLEKADLGIAFDGDGDRVGFVDERGELIRGDFIIALIAREILKTNVGAKIMSDIRCSQIVADEVVKFGGRHFISKVGHAFIKHQLCEIDAIFAGELSAHFYFRDFYGVECSDLAMLYILKIMSESSKKLSELVAPLKQYYHSGEINFEVKDKQTVLKNLEQRFFSFHPKISNLDGLRLDFEDPRTGEIDWWFNVRSSNTEPLLRLNMEARTAEQLKKRLGELTESIKSA